jgi:hypothetical protein
MRKIAAALLAALPLVAAAEDVGPTTSPDPEAPRRDAWYAGFGLAGGGGQVTAAGGTATFKQILGGSPTNVALRVEAGKTLTPRLLLGLDVTAFNSAIRESEYSASITIVNADAMVTWFPMERGLFLRGGLGLSRYAYQVSLAGATGSAGTNGVNAAAGLGYAFWLGDSFNLTVGLDASGQWWGDHDGGTTGPRTSSFWALGVGLDWY